MKYCKEIVLKPGTYTETKCAKNMEGVVLRDYILQIMQECNLVDADCETCTPKSEEAK